MFETDEHRQIACVLLPHFFWQAAVGKNAELKRAPMIVASSTAGSPHRTVVDTSPGLTGVLCGMPVDQALSRAPEAVLVDADVPAAEALFETVLSALEQVGPDIEPADPGVIYIDAHGLERLYGGDAPLVRVLSAAVRQVSDFDLRIGLGPSKWLAYVAAIHSRSGRAYKLTEASKKFLDSLPVSLLPVDPKTIGRMDEFGLTKLGDISSKPLGAVHAQFGADGALAWDLANGVDRSPLLPRQLDESISEYLEFADPTVNVIPIVAAIESLLGRAFARPLLNNRYARRCSLQCQVFQAAPWTMDVAFKDPVGAAGDALFAIKAKLDAVTLPGPLEDMRLRLAGVTGEPARQESMWMDVRRQNNLRQAIAQLEERIGEAPPIYRVEAMKSESKVPEWRSALVPLSL